jgi:NADH-quinone oxidoreductase subunit L
VLAFSTISQLGFMVAAVGVGGYIAGIFHLATHAFFKALLFLGSGSVIQGVERGLLGDALSHADHSTHGHDEHHEHDDHHEEHAHPDPQDMRNMGGLLKRMPLTGWTYIIGSIALAGIVPFAGFWSKDEILLDTSLENFPVYVMLSVAAMFTAFYMTRQVFMVFFGKPRTAAAAKASESAMTVTIPLMALAFLAFFGGFMNLPISGWHHLGGWLEESVKYAHIGEFSIQVAAISTVVALVAILGGWLIYGRQPMEEGEADPLQAVLGPIFTFLNRKWYWDEVYAALLVRPYTRLGTFLAETVDWAFWHDFVHDSIIWEAFKGWAAILSRPVERGIVDGAVNGIAQMIGVSSGQMRKAQTGYVRNYALVIGLGVVLILGFLAVALVLG